MTQRIVQCIALLSALHLVSVGAAAEPRVVGVFEENGATLHKFHAERISDAGIAILQHIRDARVAIADENPTGAKHHTWQALQMAARVRLESPTENLRSHLEGAARKLEKDGKLSRSDLKPIYQQLDEQDYTREDDIRTYLADVEKGAKDGNTVTVETKLLEASADVGYLEIDLALDTVVHNLRRAHHALWQASARRNPGAADRLLKDAQDQVHVVVAHASYSL
jgi:hypothetical protein